MTTVTSLTADRMLAIEAASVVDGDVIGGNLILTKHDGSQINAGPVTGPQGPQGPVGSDLAVLTATPVLDVGLANQIRAGRQLGPADFGNIGLSAPAGLWNLSDLSDVSGNGRNLLNKGAVSFAAGINGGANTAAQFIGSAAQALYIPDTGVNDPFRIKTGSWGCWLKTAKRGISQTFFGKQGGSGLYSWGMYITGANIVSGLISGDGGSLVTGINGITDVADDRWHFIICVCDGTNIRLYIDNVLESQVLSSVVLFSSTAPVNIGGQGGDSGTATSNPFFGRIDEAFVTADVLSEDQIRNLYCAKIPHTLGVMPSRVTLNVRRRKRGAALASADFSTQPLRLYNFSGGSLGDEGSGSVVLTNQGQAVVSSGVDGTAGNSFIFNGGASSFLFASDAGLPSGLNARSYGCWFKTTMATLVPGILGWGSGGSSAAGAVIGMSSGIIYTQSATAAALFSIFVADGLWHFAVVVEDNAAADGLKRKMYVDGKLVTSDTALAAIVLGGTARMRIGAYPDGAVPFIGSVDSTFICDYALTAERIATFYAKGSQALAPSPKNVGAHVEAMDAASLLATFDTLESQHTVDLKVAA